MNRSLRMNKSIGGDDETTEKQGLLAGKKGGACGAAASGLIASGSFPQQMGGFPFSTNSTTDHTVGGHSTNLLPGSYRGGESRIKRKGGSQFMRAALPALLVLASNSYKRKGSKTRGKRNYRSRRTARSKK